MDVRKNEERPASILYGSVKLLWKLQRLCNRVLHMLA